MRRAICPGSFDPLHNGHVEIIARASSLFDEVVVAVSHNPSKNYLFDIEQRIEIVEQTFAGLSGITVKPMASGLLAEFARELGANAIVKGLRNVMDFEYEVPMAAMNRHLQSVETVFLPADASYTPLSSSLLKEVHQLGGDISEFVPKAVLRAFEKKTDSQ